MRPARVVKMVIFDIDRQNDPHTHMEHINTLPIHDDWKERKQERKKNSTYIIIIILDFVLCVCVLRWHWRQFAEWNGVAGNDISYIHTHKHIISYI